MNFPEIENTAKYLKKTSKCLHCKGKYEIEDINVIATTGVEGLFEMKCFKCKKSTIVTVLLSPSPSPSPSPSSNPKTKDKKEVFIENSVREHRILNRGKRITDNDILDTKIFLDKFDGNFEKFFNEKHQ